MQVRLHVGCSHELFYSGTLPSKDKNRGSHFLDKQVVRRMSTNVY